MLKTEQLSKLELVSYISSYNGTVLDQKWSANWCAGDDVMRRDQPMRHDHLCLSKKAKYFRSFRDYVVQLRRGETKNLKF